MPVLSRLEQPLEDCSYPTSRGVGVNITVTARCTCGWAGQPHRWGPTSTADLDADIDDHHGESGHARADDWAWPKIDVDWHRRCGHVHQAHDDCPAGFTSPAGYLARTLQPTLDKPDAAADRLAAAQALAEWADAQLIDAVLGARLNGLTRAEIDALTARSTSHARHRWAQLLERLEAAGLLPAPSRR